MPKLVAVRMDLVRELTGARRAEVIEHVQSLWSGYGEIVRVELETDASAASRVIVKHVAPPPQASQGHPRGWNTGRSHARKLRSYEVEAHFYEAYGGRCARDGCRVPSCYGVRALSGGGQLVVLEDLDASGFGGRRMGLSPRQVLPCLQWLAHFHATFLGCSPEGLLECGTYWHLATRPDEHDAMPDSELKDASGALDRRLREARFQTFVHGDAKVANFCFGDRQVAAVDFQYVGGGCGIRDVAYFLGSCWSSEQLDAHAEGALVDYFAALRGALEAQGQSVDADAIESEWRGLYDIAWADFERFLRGWAPDASHRKLNDYSARVTARALAQL